MHRNLFGRLVLILTLLLLASSFASAEPAVVSGKLTVQGDPVAGVRVLAYPLVVRDLSGGTPFASTASVADGRFALELPPGQYYFLAQGEKYFTYYGRNPVSVPAAGLQEMNLSLVARQPPLPDIEPLVEGGVLGRLSYRGQPLAGAVVTIYTDLNSQLKGMGLGMTAPSDETGYVEAPLPPGTYYLVARKRQSGSLVGPLQAGDYFGYYAAGPLVVEEGKVARVAIELVEVPEKVARLAESLFGQTSISGRTLDAEGQPLAGVRVLLYRDAMMLNRPLYVSQPSDGEGRFVLSFPRGGTYFLAARDKLGGAPGPGEFYGRYQGSLDGSLKIETGQALKNIDLLVEEMW